MAVIETVRLADVYAATDEYGNEYLTRDYSLPANKLYVERLAADIAENGLQEPPVLVRDGGTYVVKSGNTRIRAMRSLGWDRFEAVVLEDGGARELVEATVATNVKKQYEHDEEQQFQLRLFQFGDDEYVSRKTGMECGRAAKVRRGLRRAGDDACQMTLDWLEAVGEFEGDEEAQAAIEGASAREWENVARRLRRDRDRREKMAAIRSALEAAGVTVLAEGEAVPDGLAYDETVCRPDSPQIDGIPEGSAASPAVSEWSAGWRIYVPSDEEADRDEEERLARADANKEAWGAFSKRIGRFVADALDEGRELGATMRHGAVLCAKDPDEMFGYSFGRWLGGIGATVPDCPAHAAFAAYKLCEFPWDYDWLTPSKASCEKLARLTAALTCDGWEEDEEDAAVMDVVRATAGGGDE